jgi:hypothetical protein
MTDTAQSKHPHKVTQADLLHPVGARTSMMIADEHEPLDRDGCQKFIERTQLQIVPLSFHVSSTSGATVEYWAVDIHGKRTGITGFSFTDNTPDWADDIVRGYAMSKAEHTPGPWVSIVGNDRLHGTTLLRTAEVMTAQTRGEMSGRGYREDPSFVDNIKIADCGTFQDDISTDELHANAHLISAAPDLYEALSEVLREWEESIGTAGLSDAEVAEQNLDIVQSARAALAKARGEATP